MTVATKTAISLPVTPTITSASFTATIRTSLNSAFNVAVPFDEFTDGSSNNVLVYQIVNNADAKGTIYYHLSVSTTLVVSHKMSFDWNATANTATVFSIAQTGFTYNTASQIEFTSFNHPELKGALVIQGTTRGLFGYFRPLNKPTWWNEANFPFGFTPDNSGGTSFSGFHTTNSPYANLNTTSGNSSILLATQIANANPITNKRDVLPEIVLLSPNNTTGNGIAGKSSSDLVLVAANGLSPLDIIQVSVTEEYTLFNTGSPGVAIRTL